MRWWDEQCAQDEVSIVSDPLLAERSKPLTEEEVAHFEEICLSATPGPLVVDDDSDGVGAVVASLPDGRHIVSQSEDVRTAPEDVAANAELICRARWMVLRLLRDRCQWQRREQALLERIAALEEQLGQQPDTTGSSARHPGRRSSARPR